MKQFFSWLRLAADFHQFRRQTMADLSTLDAKIDEVKQHIDDVAARVQTQVTNLKAVIADLQAKVAALPNAPDFQVEVDKLSAAETELDAIGAS